MNLTRKDIEDLKEEIEFRKNERPKILEELKEARAQGDLSENFEQHCAKRKNNQNNSRIRYLEKLIDTANIIEDNAGDDQVGVGDEITVLFEDEGEEETYTLLSTLKSDTLNNIISIESPLGKALRYKKVGDRVKVNVNEEISYFVTVKAIKKSES